MSINSGIILAIDPGPVESGYAVVEHDGKEITGVLEKGKVPNKNIFVLLARYEKYCLAVEMVASYGMPVGAEVFETCVWIGRFWEYATGRGYIDDAALIYRREEKLYLCGNLTAKDSNITQALVDRFAPGQPNKGKGTIKAPGFFYGFKKDMWQAFAVAVTYFDKYVRGIKA